MRKCADGINVQMRKYADGVNVQMGKCADVQMINVQIRRCGDGVNVQMVVEQMCRLLWIDCAFEYVNLFYEIHGVVDVDIGGGGVGDTDIFQ